MLKLRLSTLAAAGILLALAIAAGYAFIWYPVVSHRRFERIELGATIETVFASMGPPRSEIPPGQLAGYRRCQQAPGAPPDTAYASSTAIGDMFLMGFCDGRLVIKCDAAY